MIARLALFVVTYGLLLGGAAGVLGVVAWRLGLKDWYRERQARLRGRQNARLLNAHESQRCRFCLEPCSEADCYEPDKGWFHVKCLQALLG